MASLYHRAKEVFLAALAHSGADREAVIAEACGDDAVLRQEVESLLAVRDGESVTSDSSPPASDSPAFTSGEIFADRYRMVARLGEGGMGVVWRADDLVLETPVALKLIHSASPEGRARVVNEVRLARQITHPAVCRVFDVGESGGRAFYSMELVTGEDLAALLRRSGRLSSERVVGIAHQLCGGLAAAHERGVLHRDLKPANVLTDNDGRVRITDFGIAISDGDADTSGPIGTPAYMAPEQFDPQAELSERTDLYALGALLYELVTGQRHLETAQPGTVDTTRPAKFVPDVNRQLERVILQALSIDPCDRPASARAMAALLPASSTTLSRGRTVRWLVGAAVALGLLAATSPWWFSGQVSALTERDTILLADFQNTTDDPVFDGALKVALAVALEQSPFIKVFPGDRVPETLRLMSRKPDEPLTRALAREVARREQLKAFIAGSIGTLGTHYVLGLEAINVETGDVMARQQVEATHKEEVLVSLGNAASRLRTELGESLASVRKYDVALPRATTESLEALHAYSLGVESWRLTPGPRAVPHLERAIELDPDFALAYALLATISAGTGRTTRAPGYAQRAYELRDRVSERERYFITVIYHRDATQAWDRALEMAKAWTLAYPRDAFAFNHLGVGLQRFGQYDQAIDAYRKGLEIDPKLVLLQANLASAWLAIDRYDEVDRIIGQAAAAGVTSQILRRTAFSLAFIRDDTATMTRTLEASVGVGQTQSAYEWTAGAAAFGGHLNAAHEEFQVGARLAVQSGFKEVAAHLAGHDAVAHAAVGQCDMTRKDADAALESSRDNLTLELSALGLALCGADVEVSNLLAELDSRYPDATLTRRVSMPVAAAAVAVRRHQPQQAITLLASVKPYDRSMKSAYWPAYLRGLAFLQLRSAKNAAGEFQSILDHRGEQPFSDIYPLASLGAARAAAMGGDVERARAYYQGFLTSWAHADAGLRPLKEARDELARLK